jgi:anti-anti-sigma regulatory factor
VLNSGRQVFTMRATLTFAYDAPFAHVQMGGDLDLSTGEELTDVFTCLEMCGCTRLEVDADGVTFIDAYTLALLRREQRRLREAAGDLLVTSASSYYRLVCGLAEYDSLQPESDRSPQLTALHARRQRYLHKDD